MIDLYFWTTDNGYKARQMVEESGVEHTLKPVNIRERQQFDPDYLKISPGHKIPALVDHDGPGGATVSIFESGAILKYLGEKAAPELYPADPVQRIGVDQWFIYGSATWTTLAQQFGLFWQRFGEDVPAAKKHYEATVRDMLEMYDGRLGESAYLAGDSYTIADIATYPDVHLHGVEHFGLENFPNVKRWHDEIAARPAVVRAWGDF